ncbi:MAG: BMP family ABC transporter substrate-binding protein [Lachnospiraceae bacterium]|nr:BMP family ABC transporter substrate-binding protein [Lachnospiraceae bacterium]
MKKRTLSVLLAASMAASMLAGCGSSNGTAETTKAAETTAAEAGAENKEVSGDQMIAMITDSGDITDESFNQITWETCVAYGKEHGIETEYFKPAEDTDEERINSIDLAIAEGATVVVMPGYLFGPAIAEEQEINPDVTFIGIDITDGDVVNLSGEATGVKDNVYICSFEEEQAGYLAGYGAVKDGYTSLGFLGGIAVPAVIRYGYGYVQGINAAAEEMGVDVNVKYYYGGQFYGDDAITAKMEGWFADGTQVVFACGGGIYTSVVDAAKEYDGKLIGVDVDQHAKLGDICITSAMKGLGSAVTDALDAYFNNEWSSHAGKSEILGLGQGDYLGLPTDDASWGFKTFTKDEYETILSGLKDGSISVSNDTENQPEVGSHVTVDYVQ